MFDERLVNDSIDIIKTEPFTLIYKEFISQQRAQENECIGRCILFLITESKGSYLKLRDKYFKIK